MIAYEEPSTHAQGRLSFPLLDRPNRRLRPVLAPREILQHSLSLTAINVDAGKPNLF
jgi:hypothetical protein